MKKLILIFVSLFLFECNNNTKNKNSEAIEASKKADSLAVNSIAKNDSVSILSERESNRRETDISENKSPISEKTGVSSPTVNKKKRWSNKKKGVIIGATSGAIAGAVVSKKKGKGAIVGGVIGAGVGLTTGAILDNKEKNQ
ncbi:MAG: hypothetical protein V4683_05570 [Bacteroidota bacterium]